MLFLGTVLFLGAYALLPLLLENLVAQGLQNQLGLAEKPEVYLESEPLSTLTGTFEGGRVTLANPQFGDVHPDEVTVDLDPFNVDVLGSVTSGRVKSEEPVSGSLRAEVPEREVARIAATFGIVAAPVREVELEEGWMIVGSEAKVFGARIPVVVEGTLALRRGTLRFEPVQIRPLGAPVPTRLTRGLVREVSFSYPINESPFEVTFSDVEVHKDRLVLFGTVQSLPLG